MFVGDSQGGSEMISWRFFGLGFLIFLGLVVSLANLRSILVNPMTIAAAMSMATMVGLPLTIEQCPRLLRQAMSLCLGLFLPLSIACMVAAGF